MARILGLDMGKNAVRAAVLRTTFRRADVERYVVVPHVIPEGADASAPGVRSAARREALRTALATIGKAADGVIVALPGVDASLRNLSVPVAAQKRLTEVLPFEMEALLPFPTEEAILDHQLLGQRDGKIQLLAAAAQGTRIANLLEELRDGGVVPTEIAVGAAALDGLVPLLPALQTGGPYAIVDIGPTHTDVCIVNEGQTEMARTVSVGTEMLGSREEDLVRGLAQTLAAWRATGGDAVVQVHLAGEGATFEKMNSWLAARLEVPVTALALPDAPGADEVDRPAFGTALALAARTMRRGRRLDLRRGQFARAAAMGALREYTGTIAVCSVIIFFAFIFQSWASYHVEGARHAELEEQLAKETKDMFGEETRDPDHAQELLSGHSGSADPLPHFDAFDALAAISAAVPEDVVHDTRRLEVVIGSENHEGHFELQGVVGDIAQRDEVASALGQASCFHDLANGRTSPAVGQDRINYQVEGTVRCGPAPSKNRNGSRRHDDE